MRQVHVTVGAGSRGARFAALAAGLVVAVAAAYAAVVAAAVLCIGDEGHGVAWDSARGAVCDSTVMGPIPYVVAAGVVAYLGVVAWNIRAHRSPLLTFAAAAVVPALAMAASVMALGALSPQ